MSCNECFKASKRDNDGDIILLLLKEFLSPISVTKCYTNTINPKLANKDYFLNPTSTRIVFRHTKKAPPQVLDTIKGWKKHPQHKIS